jgi:hypothetical protein
LRKIATRMPASRGRYENRQQEPACAVAVSADGSKDADKDGERKPNKPERKPKMVKHGVSAPAA